MNILVTGANGQLGNELRIVSRGSADKWLFTDIVEDADTARLDITDLEAVRHMVREHKVNVIVNCAAYTNVDKAEDEPELAELLNAKAVENLAVAIKEAGGLLVHISTDYVFGGEQYDSPIKEEQKPSPTGVYGLTKWHGEQAIEQVGCKSIIIRTAWLYSEFGKNFVKTMLNLTATKPQLKVVNDQTGTPTYALDLAEVIVDILESRQFEGNTGVYNYTNEGQCSWYDFAKKIAELSGHTQCDIQPCSSSEFPSKVKRPVYSVLDKTKIKRVFGVEIKGWEESLRKIIINL